ncbi:Holliday junction resolvase RuvX [Halorhodospira halochloris]|uniref:Holliday junction resolvase RuvX n=1 Tax=Halorhodospira halochloris TaxID=1052 RepID=UPI001EE8100F|nr:Holliday junction resolvase RuvX [Halorhodospira halochloris]MCG5547413.1 Holliday junction resolvase RuvX [Halorhodospira halochloris]
MPNERDPDGATVIGFDPGEKHIGVAVGEALLGSARPVAILSAQHGQPDWGKVKDLIEQWQPSLAVVGVPKHADDSAATSTAAAERFANRLHGRFGIVVKTIDERLSSHEAEQRLRARGHKFNPNSVHSEAAAVILETYFAQGAA